MKDVMGTMETIVAEEIKEYFKNDMIFNSPGELTTDGLNGYTKYFWSQKLFNNFWSHKLFSDVVDDPMEIVY